MPVNADHAIHLGFDETERANSPYARFFNPDMAPLPEHVCEALRIGAQASELFPTVARASELQSDGFWPIETGYTLSADGAARMFALTTMKGVTPAMWDWWFAWHGSDGQRYKLWHPRAHVDVAWQDGRDDLDYYVGRVSNVVEYLGPKLFKVSIGFVPPATVGLNEQRLKAKGEIAICARISLPGLPIETGWLVHHIRPIAGGSEMRSRMWIAGANTRVRGLPAFVGALLGRVMGRLLIGDAQVQQLMIHDAQEMNHLAAILPELYAAFASNADKTGV